MIYGLWDNTPFPESMQQNMIAWQNQGWVVHVWNRTECEHFLQNHTDSYWWELYLKLTRPVQRADLLRYLIVCEYGGAYVDIDVTPIVPWKARWEKCKREQSGALFFIEQTMNEEWAKFTADHFSCRQGIPEQIVRLANFAFASTRHHPVWTIILNHVKERSERLLQKTQSLSDYEVLYSTGPDAVTDALANQLHQVNIEEASDWIEHECHGSWRHGKDQM